VTHIRGLNVFVYVLFTLMCKVANNSKTIHNNEKDVDAAIFEPRLRSLCPFLLLFIIVWK